MIEVKKKPEKAESQRRTGCGSTYKMVNIRVSKQEYEWLDARANEIAEATGYAPSVSGVFRLLMQESIREKTFEIKAV